MNQLKFQPARVLAPVLLLSGAAILAGCAGSHPGMGGDHVGVKEIGSFHIGGR